MRAVVESITARLIESGFTGDQVHFIDVDATPRYPYILLWTTSGKPAYESLADDEFLIDRIGVKAVGTSATSVLEASLRAREALNRWAPESDRWHMDPLRLFDSTQIQVDRDVKLPATNSHPKWCDDIYHLTGSPK